MSQKKTTCSTNECVRSAYCKGMCKTCYFRSYRNRPGRKERDDEVSRLPINRFKFSKGVSARRGLVWTLSEEDYFSLLEMPCHYCAGSTVNGGYGLDRIDNKLGYEPGNVLPCCGNCNFLRQDLLSVCETKAVLDLLIDLRGGVAWPPRT